MTQINQRRAFRLQVPVGQEEALLRWQGVDYPVRVIDQSAGGFGVQADCECKIDVDHPACLIWHEGTCQVRVVDRINEGTFARLGLQRTDETDFENDDAPATSHWLFRTGRRGLPGFELSPYVMGLMVLLGIALTGMTWELMPHDASQTLRAQAVSHDKPKEASTAEFRRSATKVTDQISSFVRAIAVQRALNSASLPRPARNWLTGQAQVVEGILNGLVRSLARTPVSAQKTTRAIERAAADTADKITRGVTDGSESLISALPRCMGLLRLTDRQRRELNAVIRETHEATENVHRRARQLGTQQVMHEIEQIRQTANKAVVALLSPAQVEKLRSLTASPRHGTSKPASAP